jgi:ferric-dicitrate binding protein FerR (iron transport regulator)
VPKLLERSRDAVETEQFVATGIGERRTIRLSDGTSVTLAPLSVLHFPARFSSDARTVTLAGQASFSVAHDAARPFSVRTTGLTARVLGTEFDVREDTVAHTVDVVVTSGRVRLMTPTDSAGPVLTARELGHADMVNGKITVSKDVQLEDFMGWHTGHLRFEKRPLRDVIPEVERWFDVDIIVTDSRLASRTLSADLRVGKNATLEALLGAITLPIDARYQRQGRTITIVRR